MAERTALVVARFARLLMRAGYGLRRSHRRAPRRGGPSPLWWANAHHAAAIATGIPVVANTTTDIAEPDDTTGGSDADDLLCQNGEHDEARQEFLRAAELTRNIRERRVMLERATHARCTADEVVHRFHRTLRRPAPTTGRTRGRPRSPDRFGLAPARRPGRSVRQWWPVFARTGRDQGATAAQRVPCSSRGTARPGRVHATTARVEPDAAPAQQPSLRGDT